MHHGNYGNVDIPMNLFKGVYKGRNVLITGHTGFKGSWLTLWLQELGANVIGLALKPPTKPSHFELLNLDIKSIMGDIRDQKALIKTFHKYNPEIVFHMAAQPIVRYSYDNPTETFETNVMGTVNVLEASRKTASVKAIVNVTSDKVYENKEWEWGYRENDTIGGYDPYSCSKGCSELVTSSYRNSFFKNKALIASARAGNVIGGGDWAVDRLIPDIMRAVSKGKQVLIRNSQAIRPWQHVLESLSGYLLLGQRLLDGKREFAQAWNFGQNYSDSWKVEEIVKGAKAFWPEIKYTMHHAHKTPHEAGLLKLDCSKAYERLLWVPLWTTEKSLKKTINWYKEFYKNANVMSNRDLDEYIADAKIKKAVWIS
jgi:CDP-glucose 4,6-dehydratase